MVVLLVGGCGKKSKIALETKEVEIKKELKIKDIVKKDDNIKIINGDDVIDTTKLGKKDVIIKYIDKSDKEYYETLVIEVMDKTAPNITSDDSFEVILGSEIDLLSKAKVTDNYDEDVSLSIEGDYDLKKEGEYKLKFVATDASGNKTEKEFILNVKAVSIKTTGYYVYKTKETWHEFQFTKDNKVFYLPWFCPGMGCGGYSLNGTYKVSGNKIVATFTSEINEMGEKNKLKTPEVWEFTINSEKQIVFRNNKYNWQKTFEK